MAVAATVMAVMGSGIEHVPGQRMALLLLGVLSIAVVRRRCKRSENGIIPARLMTRSPRVAGYAIVAILAATSGALFYLGVLLLQDYLGLTPMQTGLAWLPFCLGFLPGIFLSQLVMQRWNSQAATVIGLATSALGFALFAFGVPLHSYWLGMLTAMLVTSIEFGCVAPVAQSLATSDFSGQAGATGGDQCHNAAAHRTGSVVSRGHVYTYRRFRTAVPPSCSTPGTHAAKALASTWVTTSG